MGAFRRIEDEKASPTALGILIPPSRRTFVILRPRSLAFDLLLLRRPEETFFRELSHDEATAAAHQVYRALEEWAKGGDGAVEVVAHPDGGRWLRVQVGPLYFIACARIPGQPYRPLIYADADTVQAAVARLTVILCPPAGTEQELYFNTHHFQA